MIIQNINKKIAGEKTLFFADIRFENGKEKRLEYVVCGKGLENINIDGTPFLAATLSAAMANNENIHVRGSVCPTALNGMKKIVKITSQRKSNMHSIKISTDKLNSNPKAPQLVGSFFSGGVDSFATYLKHKGNSKTKISTLIFVWGFDIRLNNRSLYENALKNIKSFARIEKINIITVKSNFRDIIDEFVPWDWGHGSGLGSVSLLLRDIFKIIYIPSSEQGTKKYSFRKYAYGTHPAIDKHWSASHMSVINDGDKYTRLEKIHKFIINSDSALQYLRVCWKNSKGEYNCGKCEKCIRTMISLYVYDALKKCKTFNSELDIKAIRRMKITPIGLKFYDQENLNALKKFKRSPELINALIEAMEKVLKKSLFSKIRDKIHELDNKYNRDRLFWLLSKYNFIN